MVGQTTIVLHWKVGGRCVAKQGADGAIHVLFLFGLLYFLIQPHQHLSVYNSLRQDPAHETELPIEPSNCDHQPRRNAVDTVPW